MGAEKALLALAGRPLIAHVVERLRPQVDELFINANGDAARFRSFGCAVVADEAGADLAGPLAGVSAAIAFARARGFSLLATAPCDAPFLPLDLVARLATAMAASGAPVALAEARAASSRCSRCGARSRQAKSRRSSRAARRARAESWRGSAPPASSSRPTRAATPFANLNGPDDFAAAEARLG